jgi:periplasmic protein CpxP/Spy
MKLTRLTAFTVLGFTLGVAVALSIPHVINLKLPVQAQASSSNNPVSEETAPSPNSVSQRRNDRGKRIGQLFQSLNLTPDQRKKLKSVQQEYQGQIREQQRNVQEARQTMQQMLGNNTPSATVLAKFQDVQQMQQSLGQLRFKSLLAMREVLTPTQRQELATQMMNRQNKLQKKGELKRSQQ